MLATVSAARRVCGMTENLNPWTLLSHDSFAASADVLFRYRIDTSDPLAIIRLRWLDGNFVSRQHCVKQVHWEIRRCGAPLSFRPRAAPSGGAFRPCPTD